MNEALGSDSRGALRSVAGTFRKRPAALKRLLAHWFACGDAAPDLGWGAIDSLLRKRIGEVGGVHEFRAAATYLPGDCHLHSVTAVGDLSGARTSAVKIRG
jgi:hypothetical protein